MKILLLCLLTATTHAAIQPHGLFSNGGVLQQGVEVPVWGTANTGDKVTVKFQGQEVSTVAQDGRWLVKLQPLKPGGPFTMSIADREITDLHVGEVWVCSGQSNMEWPLQKTTNAAAAIAGANDPLLRVLTVPATFIAEPQLDINAQWRICSSNTAPHFTAVGYYFGRELRQALKVPVGLVNSSVGGTPAQAWASAPSMRGDPQYSEFFTGHDKSISNYFAALAKYTDELLPKWQAEAAEAKADARPEPKKPAAPVSPVDRGPGCLFNGMIAPLLPYAIRGVIWYQGESNVNNPAQYQTLFPTLIRDWRNAWQQGDFPFLFVQIAPFRTMTPKLREAQLRVWQQTTNTAMVVTTDCGDALDIHPRWKEPVGQRLARAARAIAYGEKIEYSGPLYDSLKVDGNRIVLNFQHTGTGLVAKGDNLKGFTIAGADKIFTNANAQIAGNQVIVSSPAIPQPVAVRYGWSNVPDVNLYNHEGLPAVPFRTDP
ncbi:MAG: hypothetical protein PCFJNLEI_03843 [Verrucomicrobiae bacterium]|nr:hypothetical protein [Verrucomicrobiae bacterium]